MNRIVIGFVVVVMCAAAAQTATDEPVRVTWPIWEPPRLQLPEQFPKPTAAKVMVAKLRVLDVRVVLEETPIADTQRRLGGTIGKRGDGAEFLQWLCFCGTDQEGHWALWLTSSELGGDNIDGFVWQRIRKNAKPDRRCRTVPKGQGAINLPVALGLGTTETQVREILGPPTLEYRNTLIFDHEHETTIAGEPYTVTNTVYVVLHDGHVSAIHVVKNTVN